MMSFTQVNNYPVWRSLIDVSDVDLSNESTVKQLNRPAKYRLSITNLGAIRVADYLKSPEFKDKVIETLKTFKDISSIYPTNILENLKDHTSLGFSFCKQTFDNHLLHTDDKTSVAQGLIYFDKEHVSDHSTRVYPHYPMKTVMIEGNTTAGNGLLILNTNNSWHEGGNLANDARYFLIYTLSLKIGAK